MPTISVELDPDLHAWLAERAGGHNRTVAAELNALAAAVREGSAEQTPLPVGIYAEDGFGELDGEGLAGEDPDLPVGVFDDSTVSDES